MKKELILHGMAWGRVPRFTIEAELRNGSLLSIADQLWDFLARHAPVLKPTLGRVPKVKKAPEHGS
ncbi:hypothetical protein [Streptomyces sp. NPDC051684]|uniref:hypothetical protein n=1 Tax=Streptomyces sp. NPDC051684 TaxID=3365670 RepID=UPI0037A21A9D